MRVGGAGTVLVAIVAMGAAAGCDEDPSSDIAAQDGRAASPGPTPSPVAPTDAKDKGKASDKDQVDFAMPNFTGMNLQDAQNRVQDLGVFYSRSHDLNGSRMQALDSNWKVCDQSPSPGRRIQGPATDWEGKIDFGVVKQAESCP